MMMGSHSPVGVTLMTHDKTKVDWWAGTDGPRSQYPPQMGHGHVIVLKHGSMHGPPNMCGVYNWVDGLWPPSGPLRKYGCVCSNPVFVFRDSICCHVVVHELCLFTHNVFQYRYQRINDPECIFCIIWFWDGIVCYLRV